MQQLNFTTWELIFNITLKDKAKRDEHNPNLDPMRDLILTCTIGSYQKKDFCFPNKQMVLILTTMNLVTVNGLNKYYKSFLPISARLTLTNHVHYVAIQDIPLTTVLK